MDASIFTTAVFELVQQFYHATEIGRPNAANVSRQNKCNFSDKVNYRQTQS